jgi:hypothetical protein
MTWLLRRPARISAENFTTRWRDEHGPLVAAHQAHLEILRYVQTHRDAASADAEAAASTKRGGLAAPYDAVEEYWFASEAALAAARSTITGRAAEAEIADHAATFVERDASPLWLGHEFPQIGTQREPVVARPKSGIVRVHFAIRARPPLSAAEARHYWLATHGPLVRSHAVARGTVCYQQVHRYDYALTAELCAARGAATSDYLGHAEAWFERLVPRVGPESAAAEAAAIADEANFIDLPRSTFLIGKELVFVDRDWL